MWSAEQSESLLDMQFYHTINHSSAIMYVRVTHYVFKTVNNINSGSLRFMKYVFFHQIILGLC